MSIQNKATARRAFDPDKYIMHEELQSAVEVAIALGQPLLLTGEPGTGKTLLADKVAHELHQSDARFRKKPLVFYTKTTSTARDLFYTYDAVSHFQRANLKQEDSGAVPTTAEFIELQALGQAIAFSNPGDIDQHLFKTELPAEPQSSVVLIDEIDKAPRDFTNDILNEIEQFAFQIREQNNYEIRQGPEQQVVVVMTSNSEKNLPDAFLRRCVFYHIPFPEPDTLRRIVRSQLGEPTTFTDTALTNLIDIFGRIRAESVRKSPATAELISWLRMLELKNYMELNPANQKELMLQNLSVLVKTREDLEAVRDYLKKSL